MRITVNGRPADVPPGTLADLLREQRLPTDGTAVAVNGEVVPHAHLGEHPVAEGDVVDVVRAVQGG